MKTSKKVILSSIAVVVILAVCFAAWQFIIRPRHKVPTPIKKPLAQLDANKLAPYKVVEKYPITNEDILAVLGTREYLQWQLDNLAVPIDSPVRYCNLFITYYSQGHNKPAPVPKFADPVRCISKEQVSFALDNSSCHVPLRASWVTLKGLGEDRVHTLYFLMVNNSYTDSRVSRKKFFFKKLYYARIEWRFFGKTGEELIWADKQQSIAASEQLLSTLLPILENDHWPIVKDGE